MDEYPDELKGVPLPLVALVGNMPITTQLAPHWTTKKVDGKDEPILRVTTKAWNDELFPRRIKERRPNYDGYYPDGIIKANWLYRYYYEICACLALFFDFEEEEGTDWRTKEGEITYRIDYFRQLAKNRNLKVIIVLVKNDMPHENSYDEKLNSLRKRAELDARNIHFFAKNDIRNSTKRLEKLLLKSAVDFYTEDAKSRKKFRERINRSTQQKLLVRIHFKVAFLNELAQNSKAALKYYVTAYNFLRDSYKLKSELEEVKAVADYLDYKVCKLYMEVGAVNDAVNHFSKHIKYYKTLPTDADKEFLHFAWLARQHQVFGDLLDQYPQYSSRVKGWRQPSFHYQAAANFNSLRKKRFADTKKEFAANPAVLALAEHPQLVPYRPSSLIYKFQRFIGKSVVRAVLMQMGKEEKDITKEVEYHALVAQELKIDHNAEIVTLLLKAFDKIKAELGSVQASSADRSQYQIAAQIAEQYVEMRRWLEAKQYLDLVVPNYRSEAWHEVLTVMLRYSMQACFELHLVNEAVKHALELLGPQMTTTREEKSSIQSNIEKLINDKKLTAPIVLNNQNNDLLSCNVRFVTDKASKLSTVEFQLLLEGKFVNDVQFSSIRVSFSDNSYNFEVSKEDLTLTANKFKIISHQLETKLEAVIECTQVELRWGAGDNTIVFKSTPGTAHSSDDHETNYFLLKSKYHFEERTALVILPQPPMLELTVEHAAPALLNELYCLELQLTNKHTADPITSATVYLDVMHSFGENTFYLHEDCKIDNNQIAVAEHVLPDCTKRIRFFVLNTKIETKDIKIKVVYTCASGFSSQVTTQVPVAVIFPVVPAFEFLSRELHAITAQDLSHMDEFMLSVAVKALTDFPLEILGVDLMINVTKEFQPVANKTSASINATDINFELTRDNKFQTCFMLQPTVVGKYDIGFVTLKWRRKVAPGDDPAKVIASTTQLIIPSVKVQQKFFTAKIVHSESGVVNELFPFTVTVTNHTNAVQDLNVQLVDSEYFLIGGPRKARIKINANSSHNIEWGLLPLGPGRLPLPNIEVLPIRLIAAINSSAYLNEFEVLTKPRYVFFVPSNKTPQATL